MPTPTDQPNNVADWLWAIAAGLAAAGLTTRLHESPAELDLTATLRHPGQREIEVVVDEDGYTELRYRAGLDVPPGHAVATLIGALAAIVPIERSAALVDVARRPNDAVTGYDGAVTQRAGEVGMPGPQDHVVEQERSPDQARPREPDHPRESRVQATDLQARLERLPVGHPSCPYRDDGSRKPQPPDLAQYELPLPDELPPDTDHPDPDLPTEDKARVSSDGSWEWRGHHLTPDQSRIADQALAKCREAEGRDADGNYGDRGLTPAMRRIEAQLDHGHLVEGTEKFALKEPDRFREKLADAIGRNPDKSPEELAYEIHDAVRYTFTFPEESYCQGLWDVHRKAEEQGYELEVRRNSWANAEYKGINCRWLDRTSGQLFEIQFHTQASWDAKQLTHHSYERIKDPRTPPGEIHRLRDYQKAVSGSVEIPPGAVDIPEYHKVGR